MEEEILEEEIQVQEENYVVNADLSDYYTKEETDNLLDEKADISDIPDISGKQDLITSSNKLSSDLVDDSLSANKFVSSQEKTTWNGKQDTLTFDSTPTLNSNNPVTSDGIKKYVDENASEPIYLGKMSDFNSSSKAIDLSNLSIGVYTIYADNEGGEIYLKARYNNANITGYVSTVNGNYTGKIVYLIKFNDIPETEPFPTSPPNAGCITYGLINTSTRRISNRVHLLQMQSSSINVLNISEEVQYCDTNNSQSISGKKTFTTLPESSVVPTTDNQLVNKKYVDDIVGDINTVLATLATVRYY